MNNFLNEYHRTDCFIAMQEDQRPENTQSSLAARGTRKFKTASRLADRSALIYEPWQN